MKQTIALTLSLLLAAAATTTVSAQKFGYCNSLALLADLPEVKQADSDLQAFQTQLTKKGQDMVKELQGKAAELERKKELGTISPKDFEAQSVKLQEEQAKIEAYQEEVYQKLAEKRESLYKPILEKVNNAMKDVATENGFMLIFDTASSALLYSDESLDVTKLVRTKLGLSN